MTEDIQVKLGKSDDKGEYVELVTFVKLKKKLSSEGQAKVLIKSGHVVVNDNVEMRAKHKLRRGFLVSIEGEGWMV